LRDRFVALGKQTLIYGISSATIPIVGIVTLPVYGRVLSPSQYGVVEVATVGLSVLLIGADIGLMSASQRSFFDYGDTAEPERRAVLSSAWRTSLLAAMLIAAAIIAARDPLSRWLFGRSSHADVVALVGATIPLAISGRFMREVMRLRFRPWHYTASAVVEAVGGGIVGIVSVLALDAGPAGPVAGLAVGNALAAMLGLAMVRGQVLGRFSQRELSRMLAYGLPLVPAALALWGLQFLDRFMLLKLAGLSETGEYAVANRLAFALLLLSTAFQTAYIPFQFSLWQEDRGTELRVRSQLFTYLAVVFVTVAVVISLYAREAIRVLAPAYHTAYEVVGLLAFGVAMQAMSYIALTGTSLMRRTGYVALYTGIAVAANAALNALLIPSTGMIGAGIATLAAYSLLTGLYYRRSQDLYPTPYEPLKGARVFALGAAVAAVGVVPFGSLWFALLVKSAALVAFLAGLLTTGAIDEVELRELRRLVGRVAGHGRART
jgi:O-antigen/teichoic acid export membrane protein